MGNPKGMIFSSGHRKALCWHMTSNHYPPYPTELIDVAQQAIEMYNSGLQDELIPLPEGITYKDHSLITVEEAIEEFHLEGFLTTDESF